jgi:hypothetical protein
MHPLCINNRDPRRDIHSQILDAQAVFPPGSWQGEDGAVIEGPCEPEVDAPLERLPWFRRMV